MDEKDV